MRRHSANAATVFVCSSLAQLLAATSGNWSCASGQPELSASAVRVTIPRLGRASFGGYSLVLEVSRSVLDWNEGNTGVHTSRRYRGRGGSGATAF